jgi:hypothetical protein
VRETVIAGTCNIHPESGRIKASATGGNVAPNLPSTRAFSETKIGKYEIM